MKSLFHFHRVRKACCMTTSLVRSMVVISVLIVIVTGTGLAQVVHGTIIGVDGETLIGASITISSKGIGATTDTLGRFSLKANPGDHLKFSYIGFFDQEMILGSEVELNITLLPSTVNLNEFVVVGYGTSRRKDLTGAVTRVTSKEFNTGITTNPLQQLQGKVAGLVIVQPGGDPNGDFNVRIRGATSLEGQPPLLVIDGVAIDNFYKSINSLNPADIESYDILKDASAAAIYGSRGANGVILVTTKKGKAGKTAVEYNAFVGQEKISHEIKVLSGDEWRKATADMVTTGLDLGANTDWQNAVTRTAGTQNHMIGISGGNEGLNFRGSLGYTRQEGIILNTGKEVFTTRVSANQKSLNNKLETSFAINTSVTKRDFLPDQNTTGQQRIDGGSGFFRGLAGILPVWPVYNPDGSYFRPPANSINPFFVLNEVYSKKRENFFQSSVKTDYEIVHGFKLGALGALSRGTEVYDHFLPVFPGSNNQAEAYKYNTNKQIFSGDLHGNYRKSFGKHSIDLTGVYEYNNYLNDAFGLTARGFLFPELLTNNLGAATNIKTSDIFSLKQEVRLISYLGRAVYNYDDRYLITANFRRDGSSKFGPNNRWGNFPSIALAWRASNEQFLKGVKWLDNLKLRLSYGLTGNQENLPPNSFQLLYAPVGTYLYDNQFLKSYAVDQENNPDLKWEVRKSLNLGVDFSILHDRINGTIDVFSDKTRDMLFSYDIPQPPFLTNKVYANAASAANKGIEITLGASVIKNSTFRWDIQGNIATLKNYITGLLGQFKGFDLTITSRHYGYVSGGAFGSTYATQLKEGYPAGVFWIPQHAGIDTSGHELFNNYDTEGKLIGKSGNYSDQDRVFIDPTPHFTWGLTNTFAYGNFDLSFFLRGVQGQKIFANSILFNQNINYLPGSNVTPKTLTDGFKDLPNPSTYWLRDGSYARLENATIGYNFKNLKGISKFRIYLAATNLFVITSYEGIDPEISTDGSQRYIDASYYPKTRGYTFGVNLGF